MAFICRRSMVQNAGVSSLLKQYATCSAWSQCLHQRIQSTKPCSRNPAKQYRYASTDSSHPLSKRVQDTAEVVIIGGGVIGTSVAYHLIKAGMKNVVLLEKTELTAGSTWHAAGNNTYFNLTLLNRRINAMTINSYRELEKETGQQVGFHNPGTIRLITSPIRYDEARYFKSTSSYMAHPSRLISAEEVAKLHPLLNMDTITGALYTENDGHVDPYSLTQAYAAGARLHGAEIFLRSPVTALKQRRDGGWDVQTEHGTINAKKVVNCAGVWGREVYKMAGIDLPFISTEHQYMVTSSIPELEALDREVPAIRDLDGSYYLRQERNGLLVGPYENQDTMKLMDQWYDGGVTPGFGRELFESDLDRLTPHLERAMEICPALKEADITTVVNGPMPVSPDFSGILGPYLGVDNFWCCSGNLGGIISSGGLAQILTAWLVGGEPPFDVLALDPQRFDKWMTRDHAIAMTRETYGANNAVHYPKFGTEQVVLGRPTTRASTIFEKLKQRGAQYGFMSGWEIPVWFSKGFDSTEFEPYFRRASWFEPVRRECEFVINEAGIIDLTARGKFEVTGADAAKFLDELVAGDLPKVGFSAVGYMLSPKGKIMSQLGINRIGDDHFFVITPARSELHDLRWMLQQLISMRYEQVGIQNVTDDLACIGLAGPGSRDILSSMTSSDLEDQSFPKRAVIDVEVAGVPIRAVRTSTTGELGWELYHAKSDSSKLYDGVIHSAAPSTLTDFGWYAMDVLRLERGTPAVHNELSMNFNALEADIGSIVNLEKSAPFIGKEALSQLHKSIGSKKRVYMVIHTRPGCDPHGSETVWKDGKTIGYITSGCHSYRTGQGVAFAYIPPELAEPGTRLEVEIQGKLAPAVVTYPVASEEYVNIAVAN